MAEHRHLLAISVALKRRVLAIDGLPPDVDLPGREVYDPVFRYSGARICDRLENGIGPDRRVGHLDDYGKIVRAGVTGIVLVIRSARHRDVRFRLCIRIVRTPQHDGKLYSDESGAEQSRQRRDDARQGRCMRWLLAHLVHYLPIQHLIPADQSALLHHGGALLDGPPVPVWKELIFRGDQFAAHISLHHTRSTIRVPRATIYWSQPRRPLIEIE